MNTLDTPTETISQWIHEIREKMAEMSKEERAASIRKGSEEFRQKLEQHKREKSQFNKTDLS